MTLEIKGLLLDMKQLQNDTGEIPDDSGEYGDTLDHGHYTVVMVSNEKPVLAAQPDGEDALSGRIGSWRSAGTVDAVVCGDYDADPGLLHIDQIQT